jgi:hypothetical protein
LRSLPRGRHLFFCHNSVSLGIQSRHGCSRGNLDL